MDNNSGTVAPSQIIINGQEFDVNEAQELIDVGRKTREAETKYNTKLDNVWPEYNKVSQERSRLEQELTEAKAQLTEFQTKKEEGIETPADVKDAKEAAKKLGLVLDEDLGKAGFIKKDDLESYLSERDSKKDADRKAVEAVVAEADSLAKEINGSDGRPAFNKKAVLAYASAYKFNTLQEAYEDMHGDIITAWKNEQIEAKKAKGLKTLPTGGGKEPRQVRITNDNLRMALSEALNGSE